MKYAIITIKNFGSYPSLEFIKFPVAIHVSEHDYEIYEGDDIHIHNKYFKDLPNFNHDYCASDPDFEYYFYDTEFSIIEGISHE